MAIIRSLSVFVLGLFLWGLLHSPTPAQIPSSVSTRISRLESENSMLRSRLSRLESDVARLGRGAGVDLSPAPLPAPAGTTAEPTFDRLATLVIELRERIVALEQQVFGS
ncbi:MAG: hypothetical protein HC881_07820 [Leptolyngbyaceae cyanobacterium SL_7_1]|nr:hypothetical protein [Leptolyngbyaceae cyanobacterium SL_7_1]